jgi:D-alanyl-D-alanine carboxypeptidase
MPRLLIVSLLLIVCCKSFPQVTDLNFDPDFSQALLKVLKDPVVGGPDGFKGLSAAVDVPGQGRWIGTWGVSAGGTPITPDMRFCVASNTKTFVAGLCLKLQDEGLLHIDDSIGAYLPPIPHVSSSITIRQLLSHQSGLFDFYNDASNSTLNAFDNYPDSVWTPEAVLSTIGPPHFAPGNSYRYSNTNFLVASMVCEAAADTSFRYLLHNRIFEPLGLTKTAYPVGGDSVFSEPWAMLFYGNSPGLEPEHAAGFNSFIQAAGGIWSTANDMATWFRHLFDGNFLSESAQAELRRVEPWSDYSLGMRAKNTGGATLHYHSGAWGYRSMTMYDVYTGIIVSVLSNLQGKSVTDLADELMATAISTLPKKDTDIALLSVLAPRGPACHFDSLIYLVKNKGLLPVENLSVYARLNEWPQPVIHHTFTPFLMPDEERQLAYTLDVNAGSETQTVEIALASPGDGYAFNNHKTVQFQANALPLNPTEMLLETFDYDGNSLPDGWISYHPGNVLDWQISPFAGNGGALCRNNYNDGNTGTEYLLDLPLLNLGAYTESPRFLFKYAYAMYPDYLKDTLEVLLSTDCGLTFQSLWIKGGASLQTATSTTSSFLPGTNHWNLAVLDNFPDRTGEEVLRFRVVNNFGNNIWIDNALLDLGTPILEAQKGKLLLSPNPVQHHAVLTLEQPVENATLTITGLTGTVLWQQNGLFGSNFELSGMNLPAGCYLLALSDREGKFYGMQFMVIR